MGRSRGHIGFRFASPENSARTSYNYSPPKISAGCGPGSSNPAHIAFGYSAHSKFIEIQNVILASVVRKFPNIVNAEPIGIIGTDLTLTLLRSDSFNHETSQSQTDERNFHKVFLSHDR